MQFISPPYESQQSDPLHHVRSHPHYSNNPISSYFSIGSTFQGISDVFKSLYGITLEPEEILIGETWHKDVRKLAVIHETEGKFLIYFR
jgi:Zn-dependent oligopeptidase